MFCSAVQTERSASFPPLGSEVWRMPILVHSLRLVTWWQSKGTSCTERSAPCFSSSAPSVAATQQWGERWGSSAGSRPLPWPSVTHRAPAAAAAAPRCDTAAGCRACCQPPTAPTLVGHYCTSPHRRTDRHSCTHWRAASAAAGPALPSAAAAASAAGPASGTAAERQVAEITAWAHAGSAESNAPIPAEPTIGCCSTDLPGMAPSHEPSRQCDRRAAGRAGKDGERQSCPAAGPEHVFTAERGHRKHAQNPQDMFSSCPDISHVSNATTGVIVCTAGLPILSTPAEPGVILHIAFSNFALCLAQSHG